MNDSPPKRLTRARRKATDDEALKPTITKIVIASAKIAAEKTKVVVPTKAGARKTKAKEAKDAVVEPTAVVQPEKEPAKASGRPKKAAVPTRPSKRKTRADDEADVVKESVADEQPTVEEQLKSVPVKAKGRPKKAKIDEQMDAPISRGRQPKVAVVDEAPKTRGRPQRTAAPKALTAEAEELFEKPATVKKTTRGRAATVTSKPAMTFVPKPAPKSTTAAPQEASQISGGTR